MRLIFSLDKSSCHIEIIGNCPNSGEYSCLQYQTVKKTELEALVECIKWMTEK